MFSIRGASLSLILFFILSKTVFFDLEDTILHLLQVQLYRGAIVAAITILRHKKDAHAPSS